MLVSFFDLDDPLGFSLEKMGIVTEHWLELMLRTEDQKAVPLTHLKFCILKIYKVDRYIYGAPLESLNTAKSPSMSW